MSGLPDDLLGESSVSRTLGPRAVASQVALMSGISIVTVIVFNVLRPRNKIVYEPKVKYHLDGKVPPKISDSPFGWFSPLIHTKEQVLLDKVGLDAVAYLRFLRLCRWLFTAIAAVTCGILIPINVIYNLNNVPAVERDVLSMLTIRNVSGPLLFSHVAISYIITFLVMGFVYAHWKKMVALRYQWYRSPEYAESFYARTLMVLKVPKKAQSDEGIRSIFESVQVPYPTTSVHIGRRVGRLPELIEYHNQAVRDLEQVLVRYLKNGKIGKKRPTLRRGGFLCFGGRTVDAIDFYTNKLKFAESAITEYRQEIDTRKPENYGFASMAAVPYAHIVARMLANKHPRGTTIQLAPNPKDIIWENLNKSDGAIARKKMLGWIFLGLVCFFNTVPLLAVSLLANLASLTAYVPFLDAWANASHTTFSIVSGVLPPAVSAAFGYFLPIAMRWLSRFQGATTRSRLDRAVVARYFAFLMISQLFIFTLLGVIFISVKEIVGQIGKHKSFKEIVQNLDKLPARINSTYIDQANYWLTFFPLRGFLAVFDLAQIITLVWIWIKTRIFGRTPRDIREWTQPPDFEYAIYYSNLLYMAAVGIIFAPLAPLVVAAAAVVFWLSSFVYKYQLMFVFVTKVETGGRLWNVVINRLLATVLFMQALMILTLGLQMGFRTFLWVSAVPPIFIIFFFKLYINRNFDRPFRYYVVSDEELRKVNVHSERADARGHRLEKRFGHPSMNADLFTPMLHAKMMPLLPEVYRGRLQSDKAVLHEYGGQQKEAQVVPGGIRIAAVSQNELEYDPALYQRDRGELDWDQRTLGPGAFLDGASVYAQSASTQATRLPGYDVYRAQGAPAMPSRNDIELAQFDTQQIDQLPLLYGGQPQAGASGYFDEHQQALHSQSRYSTPGVSPEQLYTPEQRNLYPPSTTHYQRPPSDGYREAPVHRPQSGSRVSSSYSDTSTANYSGRGGNMAGRGAYRGQGY